MRLALVTNSRSSLQAAGFHVSLAKGRSCHNQRGLQSEKQQLDWTIKVYGKQLRANDDTLPSNICAR